MKGLFKQYNLKWIGSFLNVLYMASPLLGIAVSVIECGTFYTVQRAGIHQLVPWMSFPIFISMVILLGLVVLFIFYKFVYPSYYAFVNKQTYMHQNPMQKDLAELLAKQKKIMKRLNIEE